MTGQIIDVCRMLIDNREYDACEEMLSKAMAQEPHSAVPHNLMGVLLEKEGDHIMAMKHFRAAYGLDPTYVPARYNMDQYGAFFPTGKCAYSEDDCEPDLYYRHTVENGEKQNLQSA